MKNQTLVTLVMGHVMIDVFATIFLLWFQLI